MVWSRTTKPDPSASRSRPADVKAGESRPRRVSSRQSGSAHRDAEHQGRLDVELTVERGIGYEAADRMKRKDVIGVIPVDAIFSPVRRVTYVVEHTRSSR